LGVKGNRSAERVQIGENHRAQLKVGDGAVIVADFRGARRVAPEEWGGGITVTPE
jgi:hypothetical protein